MQELMQCGGIALHTHEALESMTALSLGALPARHKCVHTCCVCRCGLVGVTNVLCGGVVMEAIAYQALVEGTCEAVCSEGVPHPCPYGKHRRPA